MSLEILRALAVLAEPPAASMQRVADALELGPLPPPTRHTDLFTFQLYPYASVYLGPEGQLGGVARDRIAGFWRALGLTPPSEPDHLPVLLGAYAGLASDRDDPRAARAREALRWEHLLSWLPLYLDRVRALDDGFYRRWATLLSAALTPLTTADALDRRPLPLHLRRAASIDDPRTADEAGGRALLAGLLAPVRSGLILTRDDLVRAARDLGLGTRIGERRFVLEALLGQAPAATLHWLGHEAQDRAATYGAHASLLGPIARFWRQRATATARLLGDLADEADEADEPSIP